VIERVGEDTEDWIEWWICDTMRRTDTEGWIEWWICEFVIQWGGQTPRDEFSGECVIERVGEDTEGWFARWICNGTSWRKHQGMNWAVNLWYNEKERTPRDIQWGGQNTAVWIQWWICNKASWRRHQGMNWAVNL